MRDFSMNTKNDEMTKLILAQVQVENIQNLLKDNEWNTFLNQHLVSIKCELNRQISLLNSDG